MKKLLVLMILFLLPVFSRAQDTECASSGTVSLSNFPGLASCPFPGNNVTANCNTPYSNDSLDPACPTSSGQTGTALTTLWTSCRIVDQFYRTSKGLDNASPIYIWVHGGSLAQAAHSKEWTEQAQTFTAAASTGVIAYLFDYQLAVGWYTTQSMTAGVTTSVNWTQSNASFALGAQMQQKPEPTPFNVVIDNTLSTQEVLSVTGVTCTLGCLDINTSTPETGTLTFASAPVYNHSSGAIVSAIDTMAGNVSGSSGRTAPRQIGDLECFLNYLASTNNSGDVQNINLVCESSGCVISLVEFLNQMAYGAGAPCEYNSSTWRVPGRGPVIRKIVANSAHQDLNAEYTEQATSCANTGLYGSNNSACSERMYDELAWGCAASSNPSACATNYGLVSSINLVGAGTAALGPLIYTQYGCVSTAQCAAGTVDINAPPTQDSIAFQSAWTAIGVTQTALNQPTFGHDTDLVGGCAVRDMQGVAAPAALRWLNPTSATGGGVVVLGGVSVLQ